MSKNFYCMNTIELFQSERKENISKIRDCALAKLTFVFTRNTAKNEFSYNFDWLRSTSVRIFPLRYLKELETQVYLVGKKLLCKSLT